MASEPNISEQETETNLAQLVLDALAMDAPLADRLDFVAAAIAELSPEYDLAVADWLSRMDRISVGAHAPGIGDTMPKFLLPDDNGHLVTLDSVLADGPAAIIFLRGHWCQFCQTTVGSISQAASDIEKIDARLVFISPETGTYTQKLKASSGTPFPVLSDIDAGYATMNNLTIWLGEVITEMLADGGHDLPRYQGNSNWTLPIPATFVLNESGSIVDRFIDPDYRKRMDVDATLNALKAAR